MGNSAANSHGRDCHEAWESGAQTTFAYDEAGNRTTTENASVRVTALYDGLNRRDDVSTKYKV